jgi:uracil phosphoribosyltransferase
MAITTHILDQHNSILNQYIAEIRDEKIQGDPLRFRQNMERIGGIMAYEISKTLEYTNEEVVTPLGKKTTSLLYQQPVIASILRAGLTMHNGFLQTFDRAENAFISAYRNPLSENDFEIKVEYLAAPDLNNKTLIIADPMLATGRSMQMVFEAIQQNGTPSKIHIACAIASPEGLMFLQNNLNSSCEIWIGSLDDELNTKSYIIPGLGDAGDLAFGLKL